MARHNYCIHLSLLNSEIIGHIAILERKEDVAGVKRNRY